MKKIIIAFLTCCSLALPLIAAAPPHVLTEIYPALFLVEEGDEILENFPLIQESEEENEVLSPHGSLLRWRVFKQNFGMEKVSVRFPRSYVVNQSETNINAHAYDHNVCYTFSGFYPSLGNINAQAWFADMVMYAQHHTFRMLSHVIYHKHEENHWILDYTAHDTYNNIIIKSHTVVTPFNGYTQQATYPYGSYECFDQFVDSLHIHCDCGS